jgi:hypothetical protein
MCDEIYNLSTSGEVSVISLYDKETVEHLIGQLIKLQQEYDNRGHNTLASTKDEIKKAMAKINKALDMVLMIEGE